MNERRRTPAFVLEKREFLLIWLAVVAFIVLFWIADGTVHFFFYGSYLRALLFQRPGSIYDAVIGNVSAYSIVVRSVFGVLAVISGALLSLFLNNKKQAENALRRSEYNVRALNRTLEQRVADRTRELEDFAYVVSHDLRAPLRGIGQISEWLKQDYSDVMDDEGRKLLDLLKDRVIRLDEMVDGILRYSRIGRTHVDIDEVDLDSLVGEIIDSLAIPAEISVVVERQLPKVRGNAVRLTEVLQNLIENAVKYMNEGRGEIRVMYEDTPEFHRFCIADNGPGIDPKYHEKLFMMFETVGPHAAGSHGVGLAIVKKAVEAHGGNVGIDSEPGAGARFWFTLPKELAQ